MIMSRRVATYMFVSDKIKKQMQDTVISIIFCGCECISVPYIGYNQVCWGTSPDKFCFLKAKGYEQHGDQQCNCCIVGEVCLCHLQDGETHILFGGPELGLKGLLGERDYHQQGSRTAFHSELWLVVVWSWSTLTLT